MISDEKRKELEDIIYGKSIIGRKDNLTTTRNFLSNRFKTSTKTEKNFESSSIIKEKQKVNLEAFINDNSLWFSGVIEKSSFLTEGGEAKVYFKQETKTVLKVNDAVYYSTWLDFLNSVLIHNLFFSDTAYSLLGFIKDTSKLYAVLEQPFIIADQNTDLESVRFFLENNGFKNFIRNDYYNKSLGLILEDIHDENVIFRNSNMFFIDTVFYINLTE